MGKGTAGWQDTSFEDGFLESSQSCSMAMAEEKQQTDYCYILISKTPEKLR